MKAVGTSVRKESHIGDRDWNKRPLFASRRRRYAHWLLLLVMLFGGATMFLFPEAVRALLSSLLAGS
jgi:hypothetical protein